MSLLKMSFSASILILVIVIFRVLLLNKLPKKTFFVLWGVALCRLLIPFAIPSRFSVYSIVDMLKSRLFKTELALTEMPVVPNNTTITEAVPMTEVAYVTISPVLVIWLIGLIVGILFILVTHLRCRKEYKTALPVENAFIKCWQQEHPMWRNVQIRQSDKIAAPLTYGIFQPVILLPKQTDWTNETRLCYILTHEIVHIRQFDTLTKLLMAIALCVHWFNPFVWMMYVIANRDIELLCDETVVRTFGETTKSAYAITLIGLEEKKSRLTPLINNFSKHLIEERIISIMKMKRSSLVGIIVSLALIAGSVTVFATTATNVTEVNTPIANDSKSMYQTAIIEDDGLIGDSDGNSSSVQESVTQISYSSEGMMTPDELAEMYSVYEPFGLTYDKEKDYFYYNGKLVREFVDILSSNGEALEGGKFHGSMRQLGNPNGEGEVNVKAVRDYTKLNADGEGELIGIEVVK